jgi:acetoin utilization deacetylase AcuC-like enzyme
MSAQDRPVGIFVDPDHGRHRPEGAHPERPERIEALLAGVDGLGLELERRQARAACVEELEWVHTPEHVRGVAAAARSGRRALDPDTYLTPASFDAASRAAGACIDAVRAVHTGELRAAFVATRPPGHHAEPDRAMGFCLFDSVAVAAQWLRRRAGLERVAIVDFDVHHGNGTQAAFERDASVFYASLHEWPLYPGTGRREERGLGDGEGATLNLPQAPGAVGRDWLVAIERDLLPELEAFRPQFLLISAGFDAHERDPLSRTALSDADYSRMTELLLRTCACPTVSVLEGGYDLEALGRAGAAHVGALATESVEDR